MASAGAAAGKEIGSEDTRDCLWVSEDKSGAPDKDPLITVTPRFLTRTDFLKSGNFVRVAVWSRRPF